MVAPVAVFVLPERAYDAFIFDCDGTLADSMPVHHVAWKRALAAASATISFDWELFVRRAGKTLEVTVEELNVEFGMALDPHAVAARQRAEYRARIPDLLPVAPVVEFLRGVAGKYPVSVASGSDFPTVHATLQTLGILELVPWIVTAFDVARGKPFPDLFLLAAERMGVSPERCLVFEDSPLGIEAAARAGMGSVLVTPETHVVARSAGAGGVE
jgi:beta-phosphoglucomutase-like phosphatase (HAD superfamily)